jgi:hypothetical protein
MITLYATKAHENGRHANISWALFHFSADILQYFSEICKNAHKLAFFMI